MKAQNEQSKDLEVNVLQPVFGACEQGNYL